MTWPWKFMASSPHAPPRARGSYTHTLDCLEAPLARSGTDKRAEERRIPFECKRGTMLRSPLPPSSALRIPVLLSFPLTQCGGREGTEEGVFQCHHLDKNERAFSPPSSQRISQRNRRMDARLPTSETRPAERDRGAYLRARAGERPWVSPPTMSPLRPRATGAGRTDPPPRGLPQSPDSDIVRTRTGHRRWRRQPKRKYRLVRKK